MILHTIKCKECEGQFKAECGARRYCSKDCRSIAMRKQSKMYYRQKLKRVYTKREMPLFEGINVRLYTTPHDMYLDKQMEHAIQEIKEQYP